MPILTIEELEERIKQLKTGEIPDVGVDVPEYNTSWDFYRMFPDSLCEHGFNKRTCYPCSEKG